MSELQSIKFNFRKIVTEQYAVIDGVFVLGQPVTVLCNLQFKFSNDDTTIKVLSNFSFSQQEKTFVKLSLSCFFIIDRENESKYVLPKNHALHLGSLVVSLARGVLHAKMEDQPFHLLVLPPINLHEFITKDVEAIKAEKGAIDEKC
jgi:hypothetical protein